MANVSLVQANHERNAVEEMKTAEASGRFHFQPSGVPAEDLLFLGKQIVFFVKNLSSHDHSNKQLLQSKRKCNVEVFTHIIGKEEESLSEEPKLMSSAAARPAAMSKPADLPQDDDDLEFDLDNMNLDDIDTSVSTVSLIILN